MIGFNPRFTLFFRNKVELKKSTFFSSQLDSVAPRAFIPQDWAQKLWSLIERVWTHRSSSAIIIQQLLGHMIAAIPVVPFAKLHIRQLTIDFSETVQTARLLSTMLHLHPISSQAVSAIVDISWTCVSWCVIPPSSTHRSVNYRLFTDRLGRSY